MGFGFLKKNGQLNSLILKNNVSQVVDFILKEYRVDYKNALITILKSMNCEELEELFLTIKDRDRSKYEALLDTSNELSIYNEYFKKSIYGFETKIDNNFFTLYTEAENSMSTGDLVVFLLKHYFYYNKKRNRIVEPAINNLLKEIILYLKQTIPLLRTEIDGQLFLPISKAIFTFFLYNKEEASNKFKNIIRKDLEYRNNSNFQYEYFVTVDRFFSRLGFEYIPRIDTVSEQFDIITAKENNSITKSDIYNVINKEDFFNKNIPLLNYKGNKLINPKTDIKDLKEFTKVISTLFNVFNTGNTHKLNYDLGEVFIENITQPFPKYPDEVLIRTREILKKMFSQNSEFRQLFFAFLYTEKETQKIVGWVSKFPKILNHYLGGLENFKEGIIKRHFFNNSSNPVIGYQKEINDFIKNHKI